MDLGSIPVLFIGSDESIHASKLSHLPPCLCLPVVGWMFRRLALSSKDAGAIPSGLDRMREHTKHPVTFGTRQLDPRPRKLTWQGRPSVPRGKDAWQPPQHAARRATQIGGFDVEGLQQGRVRRDHGCVAGTQPFRSRGGVVAIGTCRISQFHRCTHVGWCAIAPSWIQRRSDPGL